MPKGKFIPITPSVLTWAIKESGIPYEEIATSAGVDPAELSAWEQGKSKPIKGQLKKLSTALRRQPAVFLLPEPPAIPSASVQFRHPPEVTRDSLNAVEHIALRSAKRIQGAASWVLKELGKYPVEIPAVDRNVDGEKAGEELRRHLQVSVQAQFRWRDASHTFKEWRSVLEKHGLLVMSFSMGDASCRGFSVWDEFAPLIAINTQWRTEARIFTLFHEYAHLVTRTDSACLQSGIFRNGRASDPQERWCEEFSAGFLLPWDAVQSALQEQFRWTPGTRITNLEQASYLATKFKVSLRAATLRLIGKGVASWDLYDAIPNTADRKPDMQGGVGRDRRQLKEASYGLRAASVFIKALNENLVTRAEALSYLDVAYDDLVHMQRSVPALG